MFFHRGSRAVRQQLRLVKDPSRAAASVIPPRAWQYPARAFHETRSLKVVKPVLLADIGEGIVECEIIQWFVEPEARVEEFSPLCEVQSDKASVEITSRFAGVVKKLYYDAGEMAKVGKPFVDIDIQGDAKQEDLDALTPPEPPKESAAPEATEPAAPTSTPAPSESTRETSPPPDRPQGKHAGLATPAVRHLSKELGVDITEIQGTGKDGRVSKEDIYKFVENRDSPRQATDPSSPFLMPHDTAGPQMETPLKMTKTNEMMFKTMTRSLAIPHFLYADEIDFTQLVELRGRLNKVLAKSIQDGDAAQVAKLSYLPFVIKAVSMALYKYPILNARVDLGADPSKPSIILRSQHNIGVAMDTPSGLIVPVIKNVGSLNVLSIAAELMRLQQLALAGKLSPQDLSGGTITVSNIGNIGGTYLSPVIVEREVAILGVGRMRTVPAFAGPDSNEVVRKQICNFSWSADHRVIDGATLARAADVVRGIVEEPDVMVMHLR
ncbi:hypothetical protein GQ53DRAFT_696559 [Thozetella sp. PMI_491]|nr:hypothetical protein GQ53DRAFT_696559 [Thozetella sp. PMI_491]